MDRRLIRHGALAALVLIAGACSTLSRVAPAPLPPEGYLDADAVGGLAGTFSPSPQPLSWPVEPPGLAPGTDRWWLATAQAELRAPFAAQHFDCALGTRLSERERPALTRLMNRLLVDADALTRRLSAASPRARPIAVDRSLEPCQRVTDAMRDSPSWPANGAVVGAAYGEMFAALAPDRGTTLRDVGRQIGQSREVCRMNWRGDVADGERIGQALYARIAATSDFAADLEAARMEVEASRAEGLTNPSCTAERWATRQSPDRRALD